MTPRLKILNIVGARPNLPKIAPLMREMQRHPEIDPILVHTGQHYDEKLSDIFFRQMGIPAPHVNLEVGSGSHASQTAEILKRVEPVLLERKPNLVLVVGDVNSTIAVSLAAVKLGIPVAHVEAGLRSFDRTMPEEINRVLTDAIADYLFVTEEDAVAQLLKEGRPRNSIHFVGNVMIDSLVATLPAARALQAPHAHGVTRGEYTIATLHRPANVDDPATLCELLGALAQLAADGPVLFPVHPRTQARIRTLRLNVGAGDGVRLLEPLPYLEMLGLVSDAGLVITDSGGLQEETTWLGVPCVTVRPNTERPITCTIGTNRLVSPRREAIAQAARAARAQRPAAPPVIERWDGRAGERIAAVLCDGARSA